MVAGQVAGQVVAGQVAGQVVAGQVVAGQVAGQVVAGWQHRTSHRWLSGLGAQCT